MIIIIFAKTSSSLLSIRMLHSGDRFRLVESQALKVDILDEKLTALYLNLLLVVVTESLTVSQSERQCPHWAWSVLLTLLWNWIMVQGSQLGREEPGTWGRYHGTHPVCWEARLMEHSSRQLLNEYSLNTCRLVSFGKRHFRF